MKKAIYIEGLNEFRDYLKTLTLRNDEKNALLEEYNKERKIETLCDISESLESISKSLENIARRMPI